jgi:HlyD family secretion protein
MSALVSRARSALAKFSGRLRSARLPNIPSASDIWAFFRGSSDTDFAAPEPALVRDFKSDAAQIEDDPHPILAHGVLYSAVALIVIAIIWACFGTIDRIVVAQGKIVTTTPVVVMQAFGTSRIQTISVREGDRVHKGTALVSFDPAFAQADQSALESKVRTEGAESARIEAELAGKPTFDIGVNPSAEQQLQSEIFRDHTAQLAKELEKRDSAIAQAKAQIDSDRTSIRSVSRQEEIAKQVTGIHRFLYSQKAGALLQVIEAEKEEIDAELHLKDLRADLEKVSDQLRGLEAERATFLDDWKRQLNEKLADTNQSLAEAQDELAKARKLKEFTTMRSPIDGIVLEVADRSIGSVVKEAETLVTIVPIDAQLEVQADIPSRDVSFVRVKDPVYVKLEAYPFQRYGALNGELSVLSPDSLSRKDGDAVNIVFPARIRLSDTPAYLAARGIRLGAGLVATAEIKTGERSVASYIVYPVMRSLDEGMREP